MLDERRRMAARHLQRGRPERAWIEYRVVLDAQSDDPEALRGQVAVADALAQRSQRLAADFRFGEAESALAVARSIAPDATAIAAAQDHLARARQSQRRLQGAAMTPARQKRLVALLQQAAAAEARGQLLLPVGDSAFDRLRAAQEIAPRDPRVRRAAARLAPAARRCFDRELRGNRVLAARECVDAWQALEGASAGVLEARRRLAQRWVAIGTERLGAGELAAAQSALAAARGLDSTAPGLDELARRLRAAAAASR
ncbi:MAG: FIG01211536: hypothetical protein [uncultured Lysobacter sp.]|uniref:Uncharacterized protein n=1 Tax=uncultured Lysobacter sp. TaxID=271060 RepID=A0A6J4KEN0_9GAMM|nr:MAG: FIG01211536: hypothetical protein [uncultured Lysobacter sp.]